MKKVLLGLSIFFTLLVVTLLLSAEIFEDKIGNAFKSTVNETISTEFHFEAFNLSMVRSFPYASIQFQKLHVLDLNADTLLLSNKAVFKLDMLSIFQSKIKLHAVEIEDGYINIHVDKKGRRNYEIITAGADDEDDREFSISEAQIKNIKIQYSDDLSPAHAKLWAEDLVLKLNFANEISADVLGKVRSDQIVVAKNTYLINKNLSINSSIIYDQKIKELTFNDGEIGVEGILFYTDGKIVFNGDHELYDLVINNTNGSLEEIFKLLPKNQAEDLKKLSSSGDFDLTVFYKGKQSKWSNPVLQADLGFDKGRVVVPQFDIPLKGVSFSAKYLDNSKKGLADASVQINGFKAIMDGELLTGKFEYKNFSRPFINLLAKGKMPINTLLNILGINAKDTDGNIDFRSLEINGKLSDLSNPINQSQTISSADVVLDNISFNLEGKEILLRDGNLSGKSDYFELSDLEVRMPKSVFQFNGYLKRLVPFLFAEFQRPDLQFDLDVQSATCDVQEILELMGSYGEGGDDESINAKAKQVSSDSYFAAMNGDIDIVVAQFKHRDIEGEDFKGRLSFSNSNVLINGSSKGMKGRFDVEAILDRNKIKDKIEAKLVCSNVDVHQFFTQTHNFGQETLQADHLKGRLNAQLLINADWNEDGSFNRRGLKTYGSAQILKGELIDFKLMENFSSYIKSEDLKHIKFGSLENYFKIENQVIKIPAMFVQSNAVNLTMSGEHGFNNAIDYNIKVNAGQVLTNKIRKHDPLLRPIPARKKGFFNLYYVVHGNIDQPDYRTAKRQVKKDLEQSELLKNEIKYKLSKAFASAVNFNMDIASREIEDFK